MIHRWIWAIPALPIAGLASAHEAVGPGAAATTDIVAGFWHPLFGSDHLLAMFALGLLAASIGGRALWIVPATYLAGLCGGAVLALSAFPLGIVEFGVVATLVIVGLMLVYYRDTHQPTAFGVVAALSIFQGFAHVGAGQFATLHLDFGLGFALAGLLIQTTGIAAGFIAQWVAPQLLRGAGVAVSALGVYVGLNLLT